MVTMNVPRKRLSGIFFLGLITSPAVKVMLFQASDENRDPTMAIPMAATRANPPNGILTPSFTCDASQKICLFRWKALELVANPSPIMMKRISKMTFPDVNVFWTCFPVLMPRVLIQVRKTMDPMATI